MESNALHRSSPPGMMVHHVCEVVSGAIDKSEQWLTA